MRKCSSEKTELIIQKTLNRNWTELFGRHTCSSESRWT